MDQRPTRRELKRRIEIAQDVVDFYADIVSEDESNISDLITDLLHLYASDGSNVQELLNRALGHYQFEGGSHD